MDWTGPLPNPERAFLRTKTAAHFLLFFLLLTNVFESLA